jgi:hypothetical protein
MDLALQGFAPLLVPHQGGIGFGAEVHAACLGGLDAPPLELLFHADLSLVQHVIHPSLEESLALV